MRPPIEAVAQRTLYWTRRALRLNTFFAGTAHANSPDIFIVTEDNAAAHQSKVGSSKFIVEDTDPEDRVENRHERSRAASL